MTSINSSVRGNERPNISSLSMQQAREELSTAIALYRAMEMQFWLPQAEVALVQVT